MICDRCGETVDGFETDTTTCGFYDVSPESFWHTYARPHENKVCDNCMWRDPAYRKDFGNPDIWNAAR